MLYLYLHRSIINFRNITIHPRLHNIRGSQCAAPDGLWTLVIQVIIYELRLRRNIFVDRVMYHIYIQYLQEVLCSTLFAALLHPNDAQHGNITKQ